jgi:hypothetical protein
VGSILSEVNGFFFSNLPNPSSHFMTLDSIELLREFSARNLPYG